MTSFRPPTARLAAVLSFAWLAVIGAAPASAPLLEPDKLIILSITDNHGETSPCGCSTPRGGIARRFRQVGDRHGALGHEFNIGDRFARCGVSPQLLGEAARLAPQPSSDGPVDGVASEQELVVRQG